MSRYTRESFHFDVSVNKCYYYYYPTRATSAGERVDETRSRRRHNRAWHLLPAAHRRGLPGALRPQSVTVCSQLSLYCQSFHHTCIFSESFLQIPSSFRHIPPSPSPSQSSEPSPSSSVTWDKRDYVIHLVRMSSD